MGLDLDEIGNAVEHKGGVSISPKKMHFIVRATIVCSRYNIQVEEFSLGTYKISHHISITKGGFFSESAIRFSDVQISKKIFQKTILSLKFKFQAQDNFLEYFF